MFWIYKLKRWIQNELSESKDPMFVEKVKNIIKSIKKGKENLSVNQIQEDALMDDVEADIKYGYIYNINEGHENFDCRDFS